MEVRQAGSGRVTHPLEWVVVVLAVLVVPVILLEDSHPGAAWRLLADVTNWAIWLGFTAELLFILRFAPRKRAALRAHWLDVAIVVLTSPLLPTLLGVLRLTRLLRLLRLMRLAALGSRALAAERRLSSRQGFRYVALATALFVVTAGFAVSVADVEDLKSPWVGMWWAITTVRRSATATSSPIASRVA